MAQFIEKIVKWSSGALEFNQSTLSGAIDIIVIRHDDGSFFSTPFHVRFGKLQLLRSYEKVVSIKVNGESTDICMKLGKAGEAFFVQPTSEPVTGEWETSPIPSPPGSPSPSRSPLRDMVATAENDAGSSMDSFRKSAPQFTESGERVSSESIKPVADTSKKGLKKSYASAPIDIPMQFDSSIPADVEAVSPESSASPASLIPPLPDESLSIPARSMKDQKKQSQYLSSSRSSQVNSESTDWTWWTWRWGGLPEINSIELREEVKEDLDAIKVSKSASTKTEDTAKPTVLLAKPTIEKASSRGWMSSLLSMFAKSADASRLPGGVPDEVVARSFAGIADDDDLVTVSFDLTKSGAVVLVIQPLENKSNMETDSPVSLSSADWKSFHDGDWKSQSFHNLSVAEEIDAVEKLQESEDAKTLEAELLAPRYDVDIEMSLCGKFLGTTLRENIVVFKENLVSYQDFCSDPFLVFNPDLIIRYQDVFYPAQVALPLIMSFMAFGKPLSPEALEFLAKEDKYHHLKTRLVAPDLKSKMNEPSKSLLDWWGTKPPTNGDSISPSTPLPYSQPDPPTELQLSLGRIPDTETSRRDSMFRKTLRPSSEMLASMKFHKGRNVIAFTVDSKLQGLQTVYAFVYVWDEHSKIVISDIDGTITRSDLLGNIMPLVGKDWSHSGVTSLFSKIEANGYHLVYLTSRAIGQANITRDFLHSVKQGKYPLPEGPVIMSPDGLMFSFKREVIDRKPHEFKIPALRDVRNLFPEEHNPFVAGFGNRDTDLYAYEAVGVPTSKIFIVNPKGELQHVNKTLKKSYILLGSMVNEMFPPVKKALSDYSPFLYWKEPIPYVEIDPELL